MTSRQLLTVSGFLILGALVSIWGPLQTSASETEESLLARIKREGKPVKKSLLEIRLAKLKLKQAAQAYLDGDVGKGAQLLAIFQDTVNDSWQTLKSSGRDPLRQPQGFRELDIALREASRSLEDLQQRIPYYDRAPIEKVSKEIDRVREEVFGALFPVQRVTSPESGKRPAKAK